MKPATRPFQIAAALVYGVLLLTVLLTPSAPSDSMAELEREAFAPGWLADGLRNIALFFPLGVGLARSGWSTGRTIVLGIAVSFAAEMAQIVIPGRFASATDLAANGLGTTLGAFVAHPYPTRRLTPGVRARRLSFGAALGSMAFLFGAGFLLTPTYPAGIYFGGWTPDLAQLEQYQGRLSEVTVGSTPVSPGGPVPNSDALRHALIDGAPCNLRGIAGPIPSALAPVVTIHDEQQREIMLIGFDREDVVLRQYLRADAWGLERPSLRWRSALSEVRAGQPFSLNFRMDGARWKLDLNEVAFPAQAWTPGRTWALFAPSDSLSDRAMQTLDCIWIAFLVFPIAYWTRNRGGGALAIGVLAGAIGGLQYCFETLDAAPVREWLAFSGGLVLGLWCGWQTVSRTSKSTGQR